MGSQAQVDIVIRMIDKSSRQLKTISSATKNLGKNMTALGKNMTRNVTLPLIAIGAGAAKASIDLDKAMRNIQAFGGQTEEQLKSLSDQFREMSKDLDVTTDSAKGLADAYFNIQSAGFLAEEGIEVLTVSTKAATAGLTDTKTASEGVMAVLNAYGLAAKDAASVSDSLFTTIKFGVGTFEQLVPVLGTVMPIASAMGVSFDEVNAALATLSKQGIDFNKGATQIRAAMTAMLGPSTELQKVIEGLGFSTGQAMVTSLGLQGALDKIAGSVGNDTAAIRGLFTNVRAFNGVLALTGKNAETFNQIMGEMGNKVGATDEAFQQQIKSVSAQLANMKNIITDAFIELGDAILPVLIPILKDVAKAVGDVAKWFKSLDEATKSNIVRFGLFIAVLGPILTIGGAIVGVFSTLFGVLSTLAGVVSTIASVGLPALAAAAAPIALPIIAIGAAIAGVIAFWPQIKGFIDGLTTNIPLIGEAIKFMVSPALAAFDAIKNGLSGLVNGVKKLLGYDVGKATGGNYFVGVTDGIKEGATQSTGIMKKFADRARAVGQFTGKAIATGAAQGAQIANQQMQQVANNAARLAQSMGGQVGRISLETGRFSASSKASRDRALAANVNKVHSGFNIGGGFGGGGGGIPSFASAGAGSTSNDINITIEEMILPPGSTKEIADDVLAILAKKLRNRGITGISVG